MAVVMVGAVAFWLMTPAGSSAGRSVDGPPTLQSAAAVGPDSSTPQAQPGEVDPNLKAQYDRANAMHAGGVAYGQGNLDGALSQYEAAVRAKPDDPDARNNLAQVLIRQNRRADALLHLDEAVRIDSARWAFRFNRARAYGLLDRWPEAITEYERASQLFPDDYATHFNLGLAFMRMKRYAESVRSLEQAVAMAPGEPQFLISLGTAYVGIDRPDRAKATFEKFLELAPDDPEAPRVKGLLAALTAASAP